MDSAQNYAIDSRHQLHRVCTGSVDRRATCSFFKWVRLEVGVRSSVRQLFGLLNAETLAKEQGFVFRGTWAFLFVLGGALLQIRRRRELSGG